MGKNLRNIHFSYVKVEDSDDILKIVNVKLERCRKHLYLDGSFDYFLYRKLVYLAVKRGLQVVTVHFDLPTEERLKNCREALARGEDLDKYKDDDDITLAFACDPLINCEMQELESEYPHGAFKCIVVKSAEDVRGQCARFNENAKRAK